VSSLPGVVRARRALQPAADTAGAGGRRRTAAGHRAHLSDNTALIVRHKSCSCGSRVCSARGLCRQYERGRPDQSVLYRVLQEHLATFLESAASLDAGATGVPRFVQKELRAFLDCGVLARGLIRLHCSECGKDQVIGLSCKGRGFCPRCGGRRMSETSAHLTDHVFPHVPVRQWVLTVPHRLRYRIGYDHDLCKRVLRALTTELQHYYRGGRSRISSK